MQQIEIQGLAELKSRMADFPGRYDAVAAKAMQASLLAIQEAIPAYPPPPEGSSYRRTGQLGRSLGVSQGGQALGIADVQTAVKQGDTWLGTFGSNLSYAPRVIGEAQEAPWSNYWWNIRVVKQAAEPKVQRVWEIAAEEMAKFLDEGR